MGEFFCGFVGRVVFSQRPFDHMRSEIGRVMALGILDCTVQIVHGVRIRAFTISMDVSSLSEGRFADFDKVRVEPTMITVDSRELLSEMVQHIHEDFLIYVANHTSYFNELIKLAKEWLKNNSTKSDSIPYETGSASLDDLKFKRESESKVWGTISDLVPATAPKETPKPAAVSSSDSVPADDDIPPDDTGPTETISESKTQEEVTKEEPKPETKIEDVHAKIEEVEESPVKSEQVSQPTTHKQITPPGPKFMGGMPKFPTQKAPTFGSPKTTSSATTTTEEPVPEEPTQPSESPADAPETSSPEPEATILDPIPTKYAIDDKTHDSAVNDMFPSTDALSAATKNFDPDAYIPKESKDDNPF